MNRSLCVLVLGGLIFMLAGCKKSSHETCPLDSCSPRQIAGLYIDAYNNNDSDLLKKIIYRPSDVFDEEIERKISPSADKHFKGTEKLLESAGVKVDTEYEKILSEDTAEVGIIMKVGVGPLSKRIPVDQFIMKKQDGLWKFNYAVSMLSKKELEKRIKISPETAWVYYNLGMLLQSDNPYEACKYFQRYYELEPEGFWVQDELLNKLQILENPSKEESVLLKELNAYPEKAGGRVIVYVRLIQLFTATENFDKAKKYLQEAEALIKEKNSINPDLIKKLNEAKNGF